MTTSDRVRPASVPEGAVWDEGDNEWLLDAKNERGQRHGLVKWYRPDGTLCCATEHVDGAPHGPFTRFHENGEESRTGTYVHGTMHGTNVFTRSTGMTTEKFPPGLMAIIWRCEMDFVDGQMTEGRLYNHAGERVMEDGNPYPTERPAGVPESAHFRKTDDDEYRWVDGKSDVDQQAGTSVKTGTWRYWTPGGVLCMEQNYENDQLHGMLRVYDDDTGALLGEKRFVEGTFSPERPQNVPEGAAFDDDDEVFVVSTDTAVTSYDLEGRVRKVESMANGQCTRVQEYLADGSIGQDSTALDGDLAKHKYFRRTDDEELQSFPSITRQHPTCMEVEYTFDDHGLMTGFTAKDGTGAILEQTEVYRNAEGRVPQTKLSLEEASREWTKAGLHYTSELNRWIKELYASDDPPSFDEPTFERLDLERPVITYVEELNARGEGAKARELFPLFVDGISKAFWSRYGLIASSVMETTAGTVVRLDGPHSHEVVRITNGKVEPMADVRAFGVSRDRRYYAYAYADRIELVKGAETIKLAYPTQYDHEGLDAVERVLGTADAMGVTSLIVAPNGTDVVLVSTEGIYVVTPSGSQRLYPNDEACDTYVEMYAQTEVPGPFKMRLDRPNASMSPQGDRIAVGGMAPQGIDDVLLVYKREGTRYEVEVTNTGSSYFVPCTAFQDTRPNLAVATTEFQTLRERGENVTYRLDLDKLEPGDLDGEFHGGISQVDGCVTALASFGTGYLVGFDNGYVRHMGTDEDCQLLGHLHLAGSITAIDASPDGKSFTVGTDAGLVTKFVIGEPASPNLVTTLPVVDAARTCFFRTFKPLTW